ncbi:MAG: hypoxanthine phosphoribosyltransferase [candidate division Zixibacteria bacterium]|nr:hypoxanthine phosphoribosyltransferase [candidate division Zixibacteria bacterium]
MKVLFSKRKLASKVKALAKQIKADYNDRNPVFIGILKGSFIFMADLIREFEKECELDFMAVASYGIHQTGSGVVRLIKDININIKNREVLIVEDIIDTGLTSNYVRQYLELRNPKSIEFVTLLNKQDARNIEIDVKYIGFSIPNKFVVGYGLDCAEQYRQLSYIAEYEDKDKERNE